MDNVAPVVALAALSYQVTTLLKYLTSGQVREAITGLIPWAAAFVALLLGSQADATADWVMPGFETSLGALDVASLALASLAIGSSGSVVWDFKKAVDQTDSASVPPLGGGTPTGP